MSEILERLRSVLADRYVVQREIGSGGMATVWLAEDVRHQRQVALKVLRPEVAAGLGGERFLQEIRVAARLQHPHILPLHDSGEADGLLYYVMPYVDGPSLRRRLTREGELPVHEAVRIVRDVVDALTEAHAHDVVHRDVKPENVLLRGRHALVTDFGVAKALSEATGRHRVTTAGVSLGTPAYMAPEQAAADPHLDHRVDLYAVGVLAYELLAGRPPFEAATAQQVLAAHVSQAPKSVSERRPAVPPALDEVVMRCLEKRPADRWQSAEELLRQLEGMLTPSGGMTPVAGLVPAGGIGSRSSGLRRWWPSALAVGALVAATWLLLPRLSGRGDSAASLANVRQLTANPSRTAVAAMAISPDGDYLAYADREGLHVLILESGEVRTLDTGDGLARSGALWQGVLWHPGGTRLYFMAGGGDGQSLWTIPLLGGTPRRVASTVFRAAVSHDGTRLAFIRGGSTRERAFREIWVADASGENPHLLLEAEPHESFWHLDWSPDGVRLAVGNWDQQGGPAIETVSVDGSSRTTLVRSGRLFQSWTGILPFTWCGDGHLLFGQSQGYDSNVWAIETDPSAGLPRGEARPVTQLVGTNVRGLTATADCSAAAVLLVRNQADVWVAELDATGTRLVAERQLTVDERPDYPLAWSPDGATLTFRSGRSGARDLYRVAAGGGSIEPLHTGGVGNSATELPDGSVLFVRGGDVGRLPPAGGAAELLLEGGYNQIDCTPGHVPPCVVGGREADEYVFRSLDPATGAAEELVRISYRAPFTNWALSPDGRTVAVVHNDDNVVRLVDLGGEGERPLPLEGWASFEFVDWAADGSGLLLNPGFASLGAYPVLLRVDLDGTVHVLREAPNEWHVYPVASPDGRYLAFASMPFHGNAWLLTGF